MRTVVNAPKPSEYRVIPAKDEYDRIKVQQRNVSTGKWETAITVGYGKEDFVREWLKSNGVDLSKVVKVK